MAALVKMPIPASSSIFSLARATAVPRSLRLSKAKNEDNKRHQGGRFFHGREAVGEESDGGDDYRQKAEFDEKAVAR